VAGWATRVRRARTIRDPVVVGVEPRLPASGANDTLAERPSVGRLGVFVVRDGQEDALERAVSHGTAPD